MFRWYVKKAARRAFIGASALAGSALPNCVRVLTYHRFADAPQDPWSVPRAEFDRQMEMLARERRAVSLDEVLRFVRGEGSVPDDACLVTIDDGMLSTLTQALPVLEKHGIPSVAFVSSKLVGWDGTPERYLTWDELGALKASGLVAIGSHAHSHRSIAELPGEEIESELVESRKILSERLGEQVRCFAYPFGMMNDFNEATDRVLAEAGYEIAFNSMHGAVRAGMPPISLPRVKVEGGDSIGMFERISRGGIDGWRMVDENLWRLQRVRQEVA